MDGLISGSVRTPAFTPKARILMGNWYEEHLHAEVLLNKSNGLMFNGDFFVDYVLCLVIL